MIRQLTHNWPRLIVLGIGFILSGWFLAFYQAPLVIWLLTEAIVVYLAWVGTDGIALASVGTIVMIWLATLLTPHPEPVLGLTPAKVWALGLILSLSLALSLIFWLAVTVQFFHSVKLNRQQTWQMLLLLANLGLLGGKLVKVALLQR